jgi:hypothetical protein
MILIAVSGLGAAGCQASRDLRPPAPPPPVADETAQGTRKVLHDQMQQMAVEDASSIRR